MDAHVRKDHAGSDSLGHTWPEDGAVVAMPYEEAALLLAIRDGGFSIVDAPAAPKARAKKTADADVFAEVAPDNDPAEQSEAEDKPAARRPGRPRKTAVEE